MSILNVQNRSFSVSGVLRLLTRALIVLLLIYEGWYVEKYEAASFVLKLLTMLIICCTFLYIILFKKSKICISVVFAFWLTFGIVSFVFGLFTHLTSLINSELFTYFAFLIVCYCVSVFCENGDTDWLINTFIIITVLSIVSVFFEGYQYQNGDYYAITMGPNNNPNTLGLMMSIGAYYLLNRSKKYNAFVGLLQLSLAVVCFIVVLNTGSRSGLICFLTTIVFTVIFKMIFMNGNLIKRQIKRIAISVTCIAAVITMLSYLGTIGIGSSGINRLIDRFNTSSYSGRWDLYVEAWKVFVDNPIFGVGYKCFSEVSAFDYFTHSTYMELLSCTGVVGTVLFLTPVLIALKNSVHFIRCDKGKSVNIIMLFFVGGLFGIWYYNLVFMLIIYITVLMSFRMEFGVK